MAGWSDGVEELLILFLFTLQQLQTVTFSLLFSLLKFIKKKEAHNFYQESPKHKLFCPKVTAIPLTVIKLFTVNIIIISAIHVHIFILK